jgi:elongation factor P
MINLGQVKPGVRIVFRSEPFEVLESNHLKMGRGGAKLVTKMRNLLSQAVIDYTFAGDERLEEATISFQKAQFLYHEDKTSFFMKNDDYEQVSLVLPENRRKFLKEGEDIDLMFWNSRVIDARIPKKVELEITYTEPGFKGDSVSTTLKSATTETGATVMVPLFIKTGDKVRINTETNSYDSRV